ncbi:hypothetical protein M0R45_029482 [Rubus argutus]|uniref:Uncharacterized protein n=1 Tax=Rubus argutus TaxID=59490 RepID=A0AAW1WAS5_RUBAR
MDHEAHLCNKFVNMKSQRVKVEDSFAPALDDETETFEHLLAEPKTEYVTVDGVLCFGKENAEKCLNFDDFSSGFDYGLNTYSGGRHSAHPRGLRSAHPRQGDYELELGVLDGLLDEVEEVEDIHATNGLASPCDDFLLDIGFTGKVSELEFGPCERSHLGNSESRSPGLSGSSNSAVGVSESSTVTIQEFECKNHSCPKASPHKFPGDFRRKKDVRHQLKEVPALVQSEDLRLKAGSQNKLHHTRPRTLSSVPEEDSISDNLTLSEFRIRIARPKKQAIRTEFQPITSESEDEIVTTIFEKHDRRKHQHIKFDSEDEIVTTKMSEKHDRRKHQLVKSESEDETVTRRRSTRHNRRKHQPINSESEDEIVRRKRSKKHDRRKHQRM